MSDNKEQAPKQSAEEYLFSRGFDDNAVTSNKMLNGVEYVTIDEVMDEWADIKSNQFKQRISDLEATVKMQREAFQEIYTWLLNNKHNGLESEIGIICKKQLYGED